MTLPSAAVDALIASESVRDLGNDRISFRHDVLREWGIANLLVSNPDHQDAAAWLADLSSPHRKYRHRYSNHSTDSEDEPVNLAEGFDL